MIGSTSCAALGLVWAVLRPAATHPVEPPITRRRPPQRRRRWGHGHTPSTAHPRRPPARPPRPALRAARGPAAGAARLPPPGRRRRRRTGTIARTPAVGAACRSSQHLAMGDEAG